MSTSPGGLTVALEAPEPAAFGVQSSKLSSNLLQPWIAALVGFHALAIIGAGATVFFLKSRLDALSSASVTTSRQATDLTARVGEILDQTRAIKAESTELRQYLVSSSADQVVFLKILVLKPDIDVKLARNIARHTQRYASLYKRDSDLVLAIIAEESRFDPNAVSHAGAIGLMQVMPQWEKVLGISDNLREPEVSIKYGLQVLGFYMEMYKDVEMALTAYNRGPGPVDVALMRGKDPKNQYPARVLKVYERLKKLSTSPGA